MNFAYVPMAEAQAEPGLIRSRSVAPPPTPDGKIRIVEIVGLDRQACGGTHLASTGDSRADPHPQDRQQGPPQSTHPVG